MARRVRSLRRPRIESLESRQLLSVAPTLAPIANATLLAGAPLNIALDGFDADGDTLTFSATTTNSALVTTIPTGNRSLKISVLSDDGEIVGDMIFQLFESEAPRTTARIIALAQSGFYDDLIFHRVAEYTDGTPFVIQGGDPDGDGTGGSGVEFDDEFVASLRHTSAGVLSMAKSNDDTNDSQFFITGSSARHLDFNHSVFGFLVEGDSVRQAIQNTETDSNSKPLSDVVMESVQVFYDHENGVLRLSAPEGTTGEADVTVIVSDGNGGTASRTFHVTIQADTRNDTPYFLPIGDVTTAANTPVTITLPATDVEGDAMYFAGYVYPSSDDLEITVASGTGVTTITPKNGAAGVYGIFVGVRAPSGSTWDTQAVPVLVSPAAPASITLLTSSDTGSSSTDGVTRMNNSSGNTLWFRVEGVVDGAEVAIYADGQLIGTAAATSNSVVVTTTGQLALADGVHQITAIQTLRDVPIAIGNRSDTVTLASPTSATLAITVDRTQPVITSTPVETGAVGALYQYNVESDAETAGEAAYRLAQAPAGMLINAQTGQITWTPQDGQGGVQSIAVVVADRAGNEKSQSFNITVNQAPEIWTIGNKFVQEGVALSFQVVATDPDGNVPITFTLEGAPDGAAIDPLTGAFTWTPTEARGPGQYDITIRATDTAGAIDRQKIRVTVTEENLVPLLSGIADATVAEGQLLVVNASATDADLPANALTFSLAPGAPAGASIDPATGRFTWRPGESQGGATHAVTIRVTDSAGATDQKTFHVTVDEVDQPPAFSTIQTQIVVPGVTLRARVEAADPDLPTHALRYSLEPGAPLGAAIDPITGVISWNVPDDQPLGAVNLVVRATELLPGGAAGLSTLATLRVEVASLVPAAFDAALASSESEPLLAAAGPPPESLLLPQTALRLRFTPPVALAARQESPLGFQLAIHRQGGKAPGLVEPSEKDLRRKDQPKKDQTESVGSDVTSDLNEMLDSPYRELLKKLAAAGASGGLLPPDLSDAALEVLAEEQLVAETADAAA